MNFELTGKLIEKQDTVQISDNFSKRDFIIEVENEKNASWNDFIKFQLTRDRCDIIDSIEINEVIKVNFNIRGRKWEKDGKTSYFTNLEAWRINKASQGGTADAPPMEEEDLQAESEGGFDDLPF